MYTWAKFVKLYSLYQPVSRIESDPMPPNTQSEKNLNEYKEQEQKHSMEETELVPYSVDSAPTAFFVLLEDEAEESEKPSNSMLNYSFLKDSALANSMGNIANWLNLFDLIIISLSGQIEEVDNFIKENIPFYAKGLCYVLPSTLPLLLYLRNRCRNKTETFYPDSIELLSILSKHDEEFKKFIDENNNELILEIFTSYLKYKKKQSFNIIINSIFLALRAAHGLLLFSEGMNLANKTTNDKLQQWSNSFAIISNITYRCIIVMHNNFKKYQFLDKRKEFFKKSNSLEKTFFKITGRLLTRTNSQDLSAIIEDKTVDSTPGYSFLRDSTLAKYAGNTATLLSVFDLVIDSVNGQVESFDKFTNQIIPFYANGLCYLLPSMIPLIPYIRNRWRNQSEIHDPDAIELLTILRSHDAVFNKFINENAAEKEFLLEKFTSYLKYEKNQPLNVIINIIWLTLRAAHGLLWFSEGMNLASKETNNKLNDWTNFLSQISNIIYLFCIIMLNGSFQKYQFPEEHKDLFKKSSSLKQTFFKIIEPLRSRYGKSPTDDEVISLRISSPNT